MTETQADPLLPVDLDAAASFGPAFRMETAEEELPEEQQPGPAEGDLDERARQDFVGLLYLGHLEDECTVAGHRFVLQTPSQDDRLEMGFTHKPYLNSMATEPAWQMIFVSAYLRKIDSAPAPDPLSANVSGVRTRFEWVKRSIASPVVISLLYEQCLLLAARERAVVEYLDGLGESSASPEISTPG